MPTRSILAVTWRWLLLAACLYLLPALAHAQDGAPAPAPEPPGMLGGSTWEIFQRGGAIMYVILLASVIGLAFILEMAVRTRGGAILPRASARALAEAPDARNAVPALIARRPDVALHRILQAGHTWRHGTHEQIANAIEEAVDAALYQLKRAARPIGIIANVAPLLGLLGTVVGIMQAFDVVATQGALGDPSALAGGISKALLTTCFGLIVAIPMLLAHHYFTGRIEALLHHAEELAKEAYILPPAHAAAALDTPADDAATASSPAATPAAATPTD